MNALLRWLDVRIDFKGIKRVLLDREVPDRLTWWHTLGSATLTVFLLQVITGVVLGTFYSPSPDHAYDSVQYIQQTVASGALLRGIHRWGASAMVVLVIAHLLRVFSWGAYKYPREINWLLGVGLFLIVMGFGFTGYLLPWDQKAYWATAVGTNMAGTTPLIGGQLAAVLKGGSELGAATLARFYAFHVLWLPLLLGGLILLHIATVIRQGIAPRPASLEHGAPRRTSDGEYAEYYREAYAASKSGGVRFWPDIIAKDAIVSAAVVVIIVLLAAVFGAPLEPPADPTDTAYIPRPEWYFLPLYKLLNLVPGSFESFVAIGVPTALIITLLVLPLIDRRSTRALLRRPIALTSVTVILAASGLLIGAAVRDSVPNPPETGPALNAMERAGRALFENQQCGSCHAIAGTGGRVGPDLTAVGLRYSPEWLHTFMEDPQRFNPTTFMPAFGPPNLTHPQVESLARYLSTLRGTAGQDSTAELQDSFPPIRR